MIGRLSLKLAPLSYGQIIHNDDGSLSYQSDNGFTGQDQFIYTVSDGQGGTSTATVSISLPIDNMPSTVTLTHDQGSVTDHAFEVQVQFSEAVDGFELEDIQITHGRAIGITPVNAAEGLYTITVVPDGMGDISITVPEQAVADQAGNANTTDDTVTVEYSGQGIPEEAVISGVPEIINNTPFFITVTFNKDISGFTGTDFLSTSALFGEPVANPENPREYRIEVTPTGGDITIGIPAGSVHDARGTGNNPSNVTSIEFDAEAPEVEITSLPSIVGTESFEGIIAFREADGADPVTGFTREDLNGFIGNGQLIDFDDSAASDGIYILTLQANGQGDISLAIPAAVAVDSAHNQNIALPGLTIPYDGTAPVVSVEGLPETIGAGSEFSIILRISDSESGLALDNTSLSVDDLIVNNASVSDLQPVEGEAGVYRLTLTQQGDGDIRFGLKAGVVTNSLGQGNAKTVLVAELDTIAPESPEITIRQDHIRWTGRTRQHRTDQFWG